MPILPSRVWNWCRPKAFVKISAKCICVKTFDVWILPQSNSFLIKWQSTSICFVCSWKTGIFAMCKVAWLAQLSCMGPLCKNLKIKEQTFKPFEFTSCWSHIAKHEIVCCFLLFQEMGEHHKNTNQQIVERRFRGNLPNQNHTIHATES